MMHVGVTFEDFCKILAVVTLSTTDASAALPWLRPNLLTTAAQGPACALFLFCIGAHGPECLWPQPSPTRARFLLKNEETNARFRCLVALLCCFFLPVAAAAAVRPIELKKTPSQ